MSQRDDEYYDVLERYAYHHPVTNKGPADLARLIRDGPVENMGTSHQRLTIQSLGNVYVLTSLVHILLKAKITCR